MRYVMLTGDEKQIAIRFGEVVFERRLRAGLTQVGLGEMIGVTSVMISYYENGHKLPSWPTAIKLARVLGCTLEDFVREDR